jgi:hypothetical protein
MPFTARLHRHRPLIAVAASLSLAAGVSAAVASVARASTNQISIVEPGAQLNINPTATMHTLRLLGVNEIRLNLPWSRIAPGAEGYKKPPHFNPTNPADYPASGWAIYDAAIRAAQVVGIGVDLDMSGQAPLWAQPGHQRASAQGSFNPSAADYGAYVQAVGKRYSGTYTPAGSSTPLPAIRFWSVWNEPDYTASLKPQGTGPHNSIPASPRIYRGLADAAWKALGTTGHGRDKIVLGELTDRGYPHIQYGGMYPLVFVQSLYCLDSHYHLLHGSAAAQQGCPTSGGAARFRSQNPVLFNLSGVSVHPYSRWYAPNVERYFTCKTGLCSSLAQLSNLTNAVEKVQRAYGSHRNVPVYSTEYGYQTSPPKLSYDPKSHAYNVSLATAALYINWAEYLSYKNSQVASYDQYLLYDPAAPTPLNDYGSYASGLLTWNGLLKPTFDAFLLPLFLPTTTASSGHSLEVWGDARPARFAARDTGGATQTVNIQFAPSGSTTFTTIDSVRITNPEGYFDTHVVFPGSGTVQLSYTYPASDLMLAPGTTVLSRAVNFTVR